MPFVPAVTLMNSRLICPIPVPSIPRSDAERSSPDIEWLPEPERKKPLVTLETSMPSQLQVPVHLWSTTGSDSDGFPSNSISLIEKELAPFAKRRRCPETAPFETVKSSLSAASISKATLLAVML